MSLKTVKANVKKILEDKRDCRDDYSILVLTYWVRHCKAKPDTTMKEMYYMNLTSTESITRASRNLQKVYENLRGKRYNHTEKLERDYKTEFAHV